MQLPGQGRGTGVRDFGTPPPLVHAAHAQCRACRARSALPCCDFMPCILLDPDALGTPLQKLLEAAGYSMHPGAPRGGHSSARTPPSPGRGPGGVPGEAAEESPAATAKAQQGTMSGRADSCQPPPSADVLATDNGGTDRRTVAEWVRRVCQGRGAALTPCTAAVQHLAQRVGVAQAAALCTGRAALLRRTQQHWPRHTRLQIL